MNIISRRGARAFTQQASLTSHSVRALGAAHGHDDHHHEHKYEQSKRLNTQFQMPTQEDIDYQLPKKGVFNERLH